MRINSDLHKWEQIILNDYIASASNGESRPTGVDAS